MKSFFSRFFIALRKLLKLVAGFLTALVEGFISRAVVYLSAIGVCVIAYFLILYVLGAPEKEDGNMSTRLEDVRNIGLAVGGLVGAFVLIWRARSHDIQAESAKASAKSTEIDNEHKKEDYYRGQLAAVLKGLLHENREERLAALFNVEPLLKYFFQRLESGVDKTTLQRTIDFVLRRFADVVSRYNLERHEGDKSQLNSEALTFAEVLVSIGEDFGDKVKFIIKDVDFRYLDLSGLLWIGFEFYSCYGKSLDIRDCIISSSAFRCLNVLDKATATRSKFDLLYIRETTKSVNTRRPQKKCFFDQCSVAYLSILAPTEFVSCNIGDFGPASVLFAMTCTTPVAQFIKCQFSGLESQKNEVLRNAYKLVECEFTWDPFEHQEMSQKL